MGVFVAVLLHLLPPKLNDLGRLAHDVGGPPGNDLNLAAGGKLHAGRAGANGLEQGRVGLLDRLGKHPQIVHVGELSVVGELLLGPGLDHHVHGLVEPFPALVDVHADAFKLLALIAGSDAQVKAPAADDVQHGDLFGYQYRVVQGQDNHGRADSDILGAPGHGAQEGPYPRQQPMAGEPVLAQPNFVYAQLVRQLDLLQGFV